MKRAALYARVSTREQDVGMQIADLRRMVEARGWTVAEEYVDHGYSGAKDSRPALDRLMQDARRRRVDVVCCWRFDRMARSTRHLVGMLEEFRALGVDFVSHQEAVDTSTPAGKVLFTVIAAFAEFEREILRERVRAGIAKAQAAGRHCGRPRVGVDIDKARTLRAEGKSYRAIGAVLGVSHATVGEALNGK